MACFQLQCCRVIHICEKCAYCMRKVLMNTLWMTWNMAGLQMFQHDSVIILQLAGEELENVQTD